MKPSKDEIARRFGKASKSYAESEGHARGKDLELLVAIAEPRPDMVVLDVATGAGHTAATLAPRVKEVVAIDLAEGMVEEARNQFLSRGLRNATALVMDVESLSFPEGMFDVVTCRIAPHHFLDPVRALNEIIRVLKPEGQLVVEDSVAPADPALDRFINHLEVARDRTHIRSYTEQEWRDMLERAGLAIVRTEIYRKSHDIEEWIDRQGADPDSREEVYALLSEAPRRAREYFEITFKNNRAITYTDDKLLIVAIKYAVSQST